MPYDEMIVYSGHIGGMVFASKATGRCCIFIDEDATGEEAKDTIQWAHETLESGKLESLSAVDFAKILGQW